MGYDIYIGEADLEICEYDNAVRIIVKKTTHPSAPFFRNDGMTGRGNSRHPSYHGWSIFCKETGLIDLFFNEETGLMRSHPGSYSLTQSVLEIICNALERRKQYAKEKGLIAEFPENFIGNDPVPNADPHLARLMWLEFWVRWALENCKNPTIVNF